MTGTQAPPAPAGRPSTRGDRIRFVVRGIGQTLITLGLVVLLFVVYEVWITNVFAHEQQVKVHRQLVQEWAKGDDPIVGKSALPGGKQATIPAGTGLANLYIPRLGKDYAFTIVQGTDDASLEKGPGHYPGTAMPGKVGNFAMAGHRVGKGEPFLNLDQLQAGDAVVVQTKSKWFIYHVLGSAGDVTAPGPDGIPGREIVSPSDVQVIAPVPDHPNQKPTKAMLTMTTCHPKFTANQRLIIHAVLARSVATAGSALPKELSGGTL